MPELFPLKLYHFHNLIERPFLFVDHLHNLPLKCQRLDPLTIKLDFFFALTKTVYVSGNTWNRCYLRIVHYLCSK